MIGRLAIGFVALVGAAVAAAAMVAAMGLLSVQVWAARNDVVVDLDNQVTRLGSSASPYPFWLASAALGAVIVFAAMWLARAHLITRLGALVGFVATTVGLIVWSLTIKGEDPSLPFLIAVGWRGWFQHGGPNPAVHLTALLVAVILLAGRRGVRRPASAEHQPPP